MSLDARDARRYRAMEAGFKARSRGLPGEAVPPGLGRDERDWWGAGWRWRDDQVEVERLNREVVRLMREVESLRGGNRP